MRSRSSALAHVLGSNPDICGYRELHLCYLGRKSLIKMRSKLFNEFEYRLKDKYLLDKILHNDILFSNKAFEITRPKVIFLLRKPEGAIKSIINMGHIIGAERYKDPVKAMDYYCSRLLRLEEYSRMMAGSYFFIESDELVDNTEYVLERLTRWLNLSKPLDKRYSIFRYSGKPRHGDASENMKSGVLKKTKGHPDIEIPLHILQRGESSYIKCRDSLLKCLIK
jgi:hypothetical protein